MNCPSRERERRVGDRRGRALRSAARAGSGSGGGGPGRARAAAVSSREATVRSTMASGGGCEVEGGLGRRRCCRRWRAAAVWSKAASGDGGVVDGGRATTAMEQLGDRGAGSKEGGKGLSEILSPGCRDLSQTSSSAFF